MGVGFIRIFILARILTPEIFGNYALVLVALGILESVTETGINLTIIQSTQTIRYFIDTAWTIAIVRGFLIAGLMAAASFVLAQIYHQPQLVGLVLLAALVPAIKGFINPTVGVLQKDFRFFTSALFQLGRYTSEAILAVCLTLVWPSAWSLIIALVGTAVLEVVVSLLFLKPKPRLGFVVVRAKEILKPAKILTLQATLSYFVENIDDLLIGKFLGTYTLGLYHNGYSLTHKLLYDPAKSASHGLLPVYTKLQAERQRLNRGFLRASALFGTAMVGATIAVAFLAKPLILLALGDQWLAVIPVIGILALAALLQSIFSLAATFLYAGKRYQGITASLVIQAVILVVGIWLGSQWHGLVGAAWAIVLARLASLPVILIDSLRSRAAS